FFQAEDGIRDATVTGVQTCALPIYHQAFTVQATGQLTSADAYGPMIVTYRHGSPVRLESLGRVIDSVEDDKSASWYNSGNGAEQIGRASCRERGRYRRRQ